MGRKRKRKGNARHQGSGAEIQNASTNGGGGGEADELERLLPNGVSREDLFALCFVLRTLGAHRGEPGWRDPSLKPLRKALWPVVSDLVNVYKSRGGLAGKQERKRARQEKNKSSQQEQQQPYDPAADGGGGRLEKEKTIASISSSKLFTRAVKTLALLQGSIKGILLHPKLKNLRVSLHIFAEAFIDEVGSSWTARASSALLDGRMEDAHMALVAIKKAQKVPKLGAIQRWVRDAMNEDEFAALRSAESVKLLDAIIRLQRIEWWWMKRKGEEEERRKASSTTTTTTTTPPLIDWQEPFVSKDRAKPVPTDPREISSKASCNSSSAEAEAYVGRFGTREREKMCNEVARNYPASFYSVIYEEKAAERVQPNRYDLRIYKLPSEAIQFEEGEADRGQKRVDVSNLPGAFVLVDALSEGECRQIIAAAESSPHGYVPDETVTSAPTPKGYAPRASNFVWLSDEIADRIFERVKHLLPQEMGPNGMHKLKGINARLRLYRYSPGAIYRPHVDGAWPGSGCKPATKEVTTTTAVEEEYCYDAYGDRWSRLTFLIYLNDDFLGGNTTFYTPAPKLGHLEAYSVAPRTGSVLVFPHGGDHGSLVHEGSNVEQGAKYVIRTDVLYS
jgi:hypothetical protein